MNLTPSSAPPLEAACDLLALCCHEDTLSENPLISAADAALSGVLARAINDERFRAKPGQSLSLHTHGRIAPARLLLIGAGRRGVFGAAEIRQFAGRAVRAAIALGARTLAITAPASEMLGPASLVQGLAEGVLLGAYRFDKYLSDDKKTPIVLDAVTLHVSAPDDAAPLALERGRRTAHAVARARDLVNEPARVMTPRRLADIAASLAREHELDAIILDRQACADRGMNLFLAVAQGSVEEPRFIHLTWRGPGPRRRIVMVGKGITFDSGGLSLKSTENMLDMKVDMAGAATVLSAIAAAADENLPLEIHAIAPCTENMPSGSAVKLGDVITSLAGKTVEITNTDAEGRLILADALAYATSLAPDLLIDFATLTGACVVALGPHTAGVMTPDDQLADDWLGAARRAGEDMWRMPLPPRLADQLKSEIADMKNTGERWGGALTAALFLKEFVGEARWAHVDIAGPASTDKELGHVGKGATGFGVATILELLRGLSA